MTQRIIKFRAWGNLGKNMIGADKWMSAPCRKGVSLDKILKNEKWSVMQFTGLLDKNGKEIYEGDIMMWPENGNYEVVYGYGRNEATKIGAFCLKGTEMFLHNNDMEIIGNIYENPELIK